MGKCRICKREIEDGVYCIRCEQIVADAEEEWEGKLEDEE